MSAPRPTTDRLDAVYTICPVLTGSAAAAELGWLDEELERAGVKLHYLRSRSSPGGWLDHFTHALPGLVRDGGNIPAIWAHGDVQPTTLVGLTLSPLSGHLAVRVGAGIRRVEDLRGRRIGLPTNPSKEKVDWYRATSHRGVLVTLALHGLRAEDVQLVDLENPQPLVEGHFDRPSQAWKALRTGFGTVEEQALRAGAVDAVFLRSGQAEALVEKGEFLLVEDLAARPDWTLLQLNSPWTIAVGRRLADERPEAVVAYLRAAIRAARWIQAHPEEAAEVFTRVSFFPSAAHALEFLRGVDLTPTLSPKALAGLEVQKQFLLDHGYLRHDFDARAWADARFLEQAHASLAAEAAAPRREVA